MTEAGKPDDGPTGLGGWLILPMIGLVLTPLRMAYQFVTDLLPVFEPSVWAG